MTDLHNIILADAIESAVKAEKQNLRLKGWIIILMIVIIILSILLMVR